MFMGRLPASIVALPMVAVYWQSYRYSVVVLMFVFLSVCRDVVVVVVTPMAGWLGWSANLESYSNLKLIVIPCNSGGMGDDYGLSIVASLTCCIVDVPS